MKKILALLLLLAPASIAVANIPTQEALDACLAKLPPGHRKQLENIQPTTWQNAAKDLPRPHFDRLKACIESSYAQKGTTDVPMYATQPTTAAQQPTTAAQPIASAYEPMGAVPQQTSMYRYNLPVTEANPAMVALPGESSTYQYRTQN